MYVHNQLESSLGSIDDPMIFDSSSDMVSDLGCSCGIDKMLSVMKL